MQSRSHRLYRRAHRILSGIRILLRQEESAQEPQSDDHASLIFPEASRLHIRDQFPYVLEILRFKDLPDLFLERTVCYRFQKVSIFRKEPPQIVHRISDLVSVHFLSLLGRKPEVNVRSRAIRDFAWNGKADTSMRVAQGCRRGSEDFSNSFFVRFVLSVFDGTDVRHDLIDGPYAFGDLGPVFGQDEMFGVPPCRILLRDSSEVVGH